MSFPDHFSGHSTDYAKYRPGYPSELFERLSALCAHRDLVWDVGTGNGQAAVELTRFFARVVATDPSEQQIANAQKHERVAYKVEPAEHSALADASVDLITVAQAIHWFDFERFYAQANRVLKSGALIAAWTYTLNEVSLAVDAVTRRFYADIVGPYWPPQRRHIEAQYRDIPFPFQEVAVAPIRMTTKWNFEDYIGYLRTWSSTQRYMKARQHDPIELIREPLLEAWQGADGVREVVWPIHIRAGKKS